LRYQIRNGRKELKNVKKNLQKALIQKKGSDFSKLNQKKKLLENDKSSRKANFKSIKLQMKKLKSDIKDERKTVIQITGSPPPPTDVPVPNRSANLAVRAEKRLSRMYKAMKMMAMANAELKVAHIKKYKAHLALEADLKKKVKELKAEIVMRFDSLSKTLQKSYKNTEGFKHVVKNNAKLAL